MSKLEQLKAQRNVAEHKLERIRQYVNAFDTSSVSIHHLKARIEILNSARDDFEQMQCQIEQVDKSTPLEEHMAKRSDFEDQYCDLIADINEIIDKTDKTKDSKSTSTPTLNKTSNDFMQLNLPVLNLKTFSGNYKDWLNFENSFKSVIHQNNALNECQRLQYLKSCLQDEALRAIEPLPINKENYSKAWEILENRFKNERLIVQDHVLAILNAPVVSKACVTLRELLNSLRSNITALKSLNIPVESWDALLIPIVVEKLDYNTKRDWQTSLNTSIPNYDQFVEFLEKRCIVLESLNSLSNNKSNLTLASNHVKQTNQATKTKTINHATTNNVNKTFLCVLCKNTAHNISKCETFLNLNLNDKTTQVAKLNLCSNCLRDNHKTTNCLSKRKCRICNEKHHTLLHVEDPKPSTSVTLNNHSHFDTRKTDSVLLSTALVQIKNSKNRYETCRAFLDQGSMSNYLTSALCKRLGLVVSPANIEIKCLNGTTSVTNHQTSVNIKSLYNAYSANLNCLVVEKITENLPLITINSKQLEIPQNLNLADPKFYESTQVDLLIGASLFWDLLCIGQVKTSNGLTFQKTHLGFIAGGAYNNATAINSHLTSCNLGIAQEPSLENQVKSFFETENLHNSESPLEFTQEELECEKHFRENTTRGPDGRFIIKLPLKQTKIDIGGTRQVALKRFYSMERKLMKNPELKTEYAKFISEYLALNHMELATGDLSSDPVFLPHHAVFKQSSSTTKLRVVFDASLKSDNGRSLNENLMAGPVIQQDLFSILSRFRTYQFALSGDIAKMYRQIRVHPDNTNYQLIFWRDNPQETIRTFRLTTLTYGTKPASFIATRCLKELANLNLNHYPEASKIINRDFYMDDLLTGADSIQELIALKRNIANILKQGGFELRKFKSNHNQISIDESDNSSVDLVKNELTKTLGLHWNPAPDILKFQIKTNAIPYKITKRNILSTTAQIFDPLGLIGPIIMKAKIILQKLWSLKISWDESVPVDIHTTWLHLLNQLHEIQNIVIPRKVLTCFPSNDIELQGFCDASQQGYGAVIYIRTLNAEGNYETQLLCSKSRVAPLKSVTLPRLELCGALLLARLVQKIRNTINLNISKEYLWTDSSIVLAWINTPPSSLKTFVANRVSEINSLTKTSTWKHVKSENNAADILSRGAYPIELIKSHTWLIGPQFLKIHEHAWPITSAKLVKSEIPDKRRTLSAMSYTKQELPILTKYSSFEKLQKVMAWIIRFINNCGTSKYNNPKLTGNLSVEERRKALQMIIRLVQKTEFLSDITNLQNNKPLSKKSKLLTLNPFVDADGLIRVGGRLRNSNLKYDTKYPILLPKNHHVSKLIIKHEHVRHLHAGAQATLAATRQRFWIISARDTIRKTLHYCHQCFKAKPKNLDPKMGNLPYQRVNARRPFLSTGIDYAGPFLIRESRGRGKKLIKSYIALFICLSTKAVHIELVLDLSTDEFLAALKRFASRRGYPSEIFSDNATNFVGANNELKALTKQFKGEPLQNETSKMGIKWHFIPPRSPHMGGLWEINIKSAKQHLKKTAGNASLTYSEMYTLLTTIEACLNSRPLTPISSDPNDLQVLTPGHFLIGEPLTSLPDQNQDDLPMKRLVRWQILQKIRNHFWKRWSREYLSQLQKRDKWRSGSANLKVGEMVLLIDDNAPALSWKLGRIKELHPGDDGVVRVVTVQTNQGLCKRASRKVCALPIEQ